MNREQRRRALRSAPQWAGMTKDQRLERLFKNGLTLKDLERERKAGWEEGFRAGVTGSMKTLFAAVALALKRDKIHLGWRRSKRILNAADQITVEHLTSQEAIDQVWEEVGLRLDFSEAFEKVQGENE